MDQRTQPVWLLIGVLACAISAYSIRQVFVEKSEYREHYRGDVFAELNAFTGGLNFARHGFAKLYFLPGIARYEDSYEQLAKQRLYTHYPPGPDLMSGVMQRLGIGGFYQQKACLLVLNVIAVFLMAAAIRRLLPEQGSIAAWVLVALTVTSVWFVWWAGNVQKFGYEDLVTALGFWAVVSRRERVFLATCFLAMWVSFEPVPWLGLLGVFLAGQRFFENVWTLRRAAGYVAAMMAVFFVAFGLHLAQNALYFHSVTAAIQDLLGSYQARTTAEHLDEASRYHLAKHLVKAFFATWWFYGIGVLGLAAVGLRATIRQRRWLPVALLAAGLMWALTFRAHSMLHALTWRHLGIGLMVLATIGFLSWWEQSPVKRTFALVLLGLAVVRIPIQCDWSNNRLALTAYQRVVAQTDSATLAAVVSFMRDNPEHRAGKQILINTLAERAHVAPDLPAYTFVIGAERFTLVRESPGHLLRYRNLPADKAPEFRDTQHPYRELTGLGKRLPPELIGVMESLPAIVPAGEPPELVITGTPNRRRYQLLLAWLLIQ